MNNLALRKPILVGADEPVPEDIASEELITLGTEGIMAHINGHFRHPKIISGDYVENWASAEGVFTPEQCQKIIEIGDSLIANDAKIGGVGFPGKHDKDIRDSSISWIQNNKEEHSWIFERLGNVVGQLNSQFFQFEITVFGENLQFTRYYAPSGHYSAHIDKMLHGTPRKLSLSIQLNDSSEFDGGDLILHIASEPTRIKMKQGKMLLFPSYTLHEVTPVTRGTRYSLVAWVSGPPFR